MSSPIDLLTGGLIDAGGLALTTGGLLVARQVVPGAGAVFTVPPRVDVKILFDLTDLLDGDIALEDGDLVVENSLGSALLISLFTDRRADADELARFGGDDPRGWWADSLALVPGDECGSKLWLLQREKQTAETLQRAREYTEQALAWLIEDGICERVNVEALYPRDRLLGLIVEPVRARATNERFAFVWEL